MDDDEKKWVELSSRFTQSELTGEPPHEELIAEAGDRIHEVVMGLRLENSATPDTDDLSRPLAAY